MVLIMLRRCHFGWFSLIESNLLHIRKTVTLIILFMVLILDNLFGFSLGDFRSVTTGDWSNHDIWEYYNGSQWINTDQVPQSENTVYIGRLGNGHTVNVDITNAEAARIVLTSPTSSSTSNSRAILNVDEGKSLVVSGSIENSEGNPRTLSSVRINVKGSLIADSIELLAKVHSDEARNVTVTVWHLPAELIVGSLTMHSDVSSIYHATANFTLQGRIVVNHDEGLTFFGQYTKRVLYDNSEVVFAGEGVQMITTIGNTDSNRDYYNLTFASSGTKILQENIIVNNDLTLTSGHLDCNYHQINVNGTLTVIDGTYVNEVIAVDGYANGNSNISISATGNVIENFSVTTSTEELYPARVNRQWAITGNFSGEKIVTFFWSAADDNYYNWHEENRPAVFRNNTIHDTYEWEESYPRQISVSTIEFGNNRGEWTIGHQHSETLPVHLSSFTATLNEEKQVIISWTAQVETNMLGYNIFRSECHYLSEAKKVNNAIIPARNNSFLEQYRFVDVIGEDEGKFYYWLESIELDLTSNHHGPVIIDLEYDDQGQESIPMSFATGLRAAYPNPFNIDTTIPFYLADLNKVSVSIFNIKGELIIPLVLEKQFPEGVNYLHWDGRNSFGSEVKSGVYFVKMKTSCGYIGLGKILLLK